MKPEDKFYELIVDKLRNIQPVPDDPTGLTDKIIQKIRIKSSRGYLTIRMSRKQGAIFNGIRTVLTAAAILLTGFFLFQQWQINKKLNHLEKVVIASSNKTETSNINTILNPMPALYIRDSITNNELVISRKSINYMLQKIKTLQEENITFREKLMHYTATDTNTLK